MRLAILCCAYEKVKAENDWTSQQVARFPDRLRGFCGVNPLKDDALDELARCATDPQLHFGLKLHYGNSDVDLDAPQHVERLRRVFRAANDRRMAIVVHMRSSVTRQRPYGATEARVFLESLLHGKFLGLSRRVRPLPMILAGVPSSTEL